MDSAFETAPSELAIDDFNPKSAPAGSVINVTGDGFASGAAPRVTLSQQGGGTIDAPVSSATSTYPWRL